MQSYTYKENVSICSIVIRVVVTYSVFWLTLSLSLSFYTAIYLSFSLSLSFFLSLSLHQCCPNRFRITQQAQRSPMII